MRDEALGMPRPVRRRNRFIGPSPFDAWDAARAGRDVAADMAATRERFVPKKAAGPARSGGVSVQAGLVEHAVAALIEVKERLKMIQAIRLRGRTATTPS